MGDWSVYPAESLRQSAAVHSYSRGGVAEQSSRQNSHSPLCLPRSCSLSEALTTVANPDKPTQAWCYHHCCLQGSLFLFWGKQSKRERRVRGVVGAQRGALSACHGQVVWRAREGSQARLCWHVRDLQLSAGEICTAVTAGGGRRAVAGVRLVGNQGSMDWGGGKKLENWQDECYHLLECPTGSIPNKQLIKCLCVKNTAGKQMNIYGLIYCGFRGSPTDLQK